ncbi:MAG: hypothetical protein COV76_07035 [Candidatus Omnitrophica bacterium CG11_big_fil_rev_8_21_14_0_20_64_10]|nr:MAG: hypothetical protein COV76_07035 [Candidatus Omnitrophica bacterium CG11_big_fil_rev_8_21_14_0_20_64_10]
MQKAYFDIYGLPLVLTADHPLLFQTVAEDLKPFRTSRLPAGARRVQLDLRTLPSPGSNRPYPPPFGGQEEIAVHHTLPDRALTRYGRSSMLVLHDIKRRVIQAAAVPDRSLLPDPAYHYFFTQSVHYWLRTRGFFFLHAGCVSDPSGNGILIIGGPGAGKTTLSFSAVRDGFQFLSDEQPLLSRKGQLQVHAFPRRLRLNRSVAALFPELKGLAQKSSGPRLAFHLEKIYPGKVRPHCRPRLLIFPQFRTTGAARCVGLNTQQTLKRLLKSGQFVCYLNDPPPQSSARHLELLNHLAETVPAYALTYGRWDLLRIPRLFRQLLESK